ncbi:unnamed protein product [Didymodactylos carnosus]|uniref:Integrase zinc-binding domain-containing protein n=1 Tax=Didymodactylos carnosus TaxID=1234261 RepID=A0A814DXD3_9BILA|nr:unnamed protein product [Didymodactylos carnosus]CAF1043433.1 unnamed protein product [Didymodactylos carnosus]CAF3737457.1 unnamed protein product [Didymodactylos carnosus]CAF3811508.1 unnamed protein product [Didymodactylos carnosus]
MDDPWFLILAFLLKIGDVDAVYGIKSNHLVVVHEQLYTKIKECHERVGHHGRDKTWSEMQEQYSYIPYDVATLFFKQGDVCNSRQAFPKPIAGTDCGLINFFNCNYNELGFCFVLRPRHPQTQKLVGRANHTLQLSLGKWMQSNNTIEWAKGLKPVVYSINTSCAQTTKKPPYEVVFGQKPRSDFEMWRMLSDDGIEDKEQMPADFIQMLNEQTTSCEPDGSTNQANDEIYDGTKSQHQNSPVLCLDKDLKTDRTSKDHENIDMDMVFDGIGETVDHQAIDRHKHVNRKRFGKSITKDGAV